MSDILELEADELLPLLQRYDQLKHLVVPLMQRDPYAECLRDRTLAIGVSQIIHRPNPDAVWYRVQKHMQDLIDVSDRHADQSATLASRLSSNLSSLEEQGAMVSIDEAQSVENEIHAQIRAVRTTRPLYQESGINHYDEDHIGWCVDALGEAYRSVAHVNHDVVFRETHLPFPKPGMFDLGQQQSACLNHAAIMARNLAQARCKLAESCMIMAVALNTPVAGIPLPAKSKVDMFADIAKDQIHQGDFALDLAARFRAMAYHVTEVGTPVFRKTDFTIPKGP